MTTYELTYTNMDGRKDNRTFYNKEELVKFVNNFVEKDDKNFRLAEVKEITLEDLLDK